MIIFNEEFFAHSCHPALFPKEATFSMITELLKCQIHNLNTDLRLLKSVFLSDRNPRIKKEGVEGAAELGLGEMGKLYCDEGRKRKEEAG